LAGSYFLVLMVKVVGFIGRLFLDLIETVVIALSIFLVIYLFFVQPHQVNGESMLPNFENGEYLLTDKISYRLGQPQRGDVVVFHAPQTANCPRGTGCDFIKRIVALPGETVEVVDNRLYVNGRPLPESYLPSDQLTFSGAFTRQGPTVLGGDEYFVVGDNRSHSSDSRSWGPIGLDSIVGRAFFRYWPPPEIGLVDN